MAGLAALLSLSPDPRRADLAADLERMLALVVSGRTLASQAQAVGSVALGLVHLPAVESTRPAWNADRSVLAVLDGELETEAPQEGWCEALVAAYERSGLRAVADLRGVFCGAIFDGRTRELHLFTDRCGLGILYHTRTAGEVAACTQLRGFLGLPGFRPRLHREAAADLFNYGFVLGDDTLAEDVSLVPAATVVTWGADGRRRAWRYWSPTFAAELADEAEAADRFDEAFTRSLRTHAQSLPGRWGVTLSGGLDSRFVTAAFRRHDPRPLTAITYGGVESDEWRYARAAAEALHLDHHRIELDPAEMLEGYPRAIWLTDGMAAVSDLYLAGVFERFRDFMDVRLDGYLGDALLGGTYLSREALAAQSFDDCWPWLWTRLAHWDPRSDRALDRRWSAELAERRKARVREVWEGAELGARPVDRCEWFLCQNRGRRYIHHHHTLLVQGTVKSVKPFMSYDCLERTWSVPAARRLDHGFYHVWVIRHHRKLAELPVVGGASPVAPARASHAPSRVDALRKWIRLLSLGHVAAVDRGAVQRNGWITSRQYRERIKSFLSAERVLARGYVDPRRFRAYLALSGGLMAFSFLSVLLQIEWFHRLFLEKDPASLARVEAPLKAIRS